MTKRLLLLRHGKSDWSASYGPDRDRPLARRGVEAAGRIGRFVAATGRVPEVVLSSPAVRARTTVELAAEAGEWNVDIEIHEELYGGGGEAVLAAIRRVDPAVERVMVVGHEPVWSGLVGGLSGGGRVRFPTAALACLGGEGEWPSLAWGRMELRWLVTPRLLGRAGFPPES